MNQLFSLYYYELKKNKNKFLIMTSFAALFLALCIFTLFFQKNYDMNVLDAKKVVNLLLKNKNIPENISTEIRRNAVGGITFTDTYFFVATFMKIIGAALAVMLSFGVAVKDFRKKNRSFYTYSCMPASIWKIKLSKVLCGVSIYICYILSISAALIVLNLLMKVFLGNYYGGINGLFYPELVFIPTFPKTALFTAFIFVPVCVAGIQAIASVLFVESSGRSVVKKIISMAILFVCGIAATAFMVYMQFYQDFILSVGTDFGHSGLFGNIDPISTGLVIFPILFIILFVIDVKTTKKKFRGGV